MSARSIFLFVLKIFDARRALSGAIFSRPAPRSSLCPWRRQSCRSVDFSRQLSHVFASLELLDWQPNPLPAWFYAHSSRSQAEAAPRWLRVADCACAGSATCRRRPGATLYAGNPVPAPQLDERYAETVGDSDQGIAPAHGVEHVCRRRGGRGQRHHQRLHSLDALALAAQMIGRGQFLHRHAVLPRH